MNFLTFFYVEGEIAMIYLRIFCYNVCHRVILSISCKIILFFHFKIFFITKKIYLKFYYMGISGFVLLWVTLVNTIGHFCLGRKSKTTVKLISDVDMSGFD